MFRVEVTGNLGAKAEIKSDQGRKYVQFSVADTRRWKDEQGNEHTQTTWFSCFYRNVDAEVVKYLERGTKVFVRGHGDLRIYSSEKERKMMAGCSINVTEIELLGGSSDEVPRRLYTLEGELVDVTKWFYVATHPAGTILQSLGGDRYEVIEGGWVKPVVPPAESSNEAETSQVQDSQPVTDSQPEENSKEKKKRK